jgi:fructoselysine 6-kinase
MDVVAIGDNISDCYVAIGQVFPGGNAVNVSVAAARSGGRSAYIGAVGDDTRGQLLIDSLTAESVDVGRLRVVPGQTACCEVLHADGDRQFGATNRGVALFTPTLDDLAFAATASIVHSTYCSGLEEFVPELASRGRVSFDFSDRIDDGYADDLLPYVYVAQFSAAHLDDDECAELLRWAGSRGPGYVLVTRGGRGAMLYDGERITAADAAPSEVIDTLGAGDSFIGRALYGLIHDEPAPALLAASARAAARTCTAWGAYGHGVPITPLARLSTCCGDRGEAVAATAPMESESAHLEE